MLPRVPFGCVPALLCAAIVAMIGCAPPDSGAVRETDEKQYQLAKNYLNQGRTEEALEAFHRVIRSRRTAPESHLEAGYLYLRELGDPVKAIYHFDRYLAQKPKSPQAAEVKQLIETAEKEFARQLPADPYQGELDRIDLMELVKNLRRENEALKRDLIEARNRVRQLEDARTRTSSSSTPGRSGEAGDADDGSAPPSAASSRDASAPDPESVPRTYTVQSGDSLSGISRKFYGTPSRWIDIYQANRDRISSENALRVGQELRIP